MNLDNLQMFPENRVQSLFGLSPKVLAEVVLRVLPVLEFEREQRLRKKSDRKRVFVKTDGRPREVLPIHKLLMTLYICGATHQPLSSVRCFLLVPIVSKTL